MPWSRIRRWLNPSFPDPRAGRYSPPALAFRPRVEDLEQRLLLSINEFPTARNGHPIGITAGPDGNLWFTEQDLNKIGVMAPDGTLQAEYTALSSNSRPEFITTGPDGNLWFTEQRASKIGHITPSGVITEFPTPTPNSAPTFITLGPDNNLWYSDYSTNRIVRITPSGVQTEFLLPTLNSHPMGITAGPDGNVWFTEFTGNNVGSISTDGATIAEYPLNLGGVQPIGITVGPDGNLWFAEYNYPSGQIGTIAPDGTGLAEFPVPGLTSDVEVVVTGPDGNLWFTDSMNNRLGLITTDGVFQEYATPTSGSGPLGITLGPDGTDLWFAEIDSDSVGQFTFDGAPGAGRLPISGGDANAARNLAPFDRSVGVLPNPAIRSEASASAAALVDLTPEHGTTKRTAERTPARVHQTAQIVDAETIWGARSVEGELLNSEL